MTALPARAAASATSSERMAGTVHAKHGPNKLPLPELNASPAASDKKLSVNLRNISDCKLDCNPKRVCKIANSGTLRAALRVTSSAHWFRNLMIGRRQHGLFAVGYDENPVRYRDLSPGSGRYHSMGAAGLHYLALRFFGDLLLSRFTSAWPADGVRTAPSRAIWRAFHSLPYGFLLASPSERRVEPSREIPAKRPCDLEYDRISARIMTSVAAAAVLPLGPAAAAMPNSFS
jgi:hypothetical protein